MKLQILSDLHMETEAFEPQPAPGAELLVLAGDVDSTWQGLAAFAGWPVPVLFVPGNHEYDRREIRETGTALRRECERLGLDMLDDEERLLTGADQRRIRFLGSTRWSDFDVFGAADRERAMRAAGYFQRVMNARLDGDPFDAVAVRRLGLENRTWLTGALADTREGVDATVVITHFAPSLKSADPRYGRQPGTASFCNDDEALMPGVALWIHGHLHCRHDYRITHADGRSTRILCNARGHGRKGEADAYDPLRCIDV